MVIFTYMRTSVSMACTRPLFRALVLHSLNGKCHFDEIIISGCSGSCHFDNFCRQWRKYRQYYDIAISVWSHPCRCIWRSSSCLCVLSAACVIDQVTWLNDEQSPRDVQHIYGSSFIVLVTLADTDVFWSREVCDMCGGIFRCVMMKPPYTWRVVKWLEMIEAWCLLTQFAW